MPDRGPAVRAPIITLMACTAVVYNAVRLGVFSHGLPTAISVQFGFSGRGLLDGRWSTLLTSQILTRDRFMTISIVLSLIVLLGSYELIAGSRRALVVAATSAISGPAIVTMALGVGSILGSGFAVRTLLTLDYGASAITAGAGGALVATMKSRRLRQAAVVFVLVGLLIHHQIADWIHLVALPCGYLVGSLAMRHGGAPRNAVTVTRVCRTWPRSPTSSTGKSAVATTVTLLTLAMSIAGAHAAIHIDAQRVRLVAQGSAAGFEGHDSAAQVVESHYRSDAMGMDRRVVIVLPPNYDGGTRRYDVVEMLHGSPGDGVALVASLDVIHLVSGVRPFIAVLPDGNGPVVTEGDYSDLPRQRLGTATGPELRGWTAAHYRTTGKWSVAGLSSGGFGAPYLGAQAPGAYDSVCAMSGHFYAVPPAFAGQADHLKQISSPINLVSTSGPRTLLIVGRDDPVAQLATNSYAQAMERVHQRHSPVVVLPGGHDYSVWMPGMALCVRFALNG